MEPANVQASDDPGGKKQNPVNREQDTIPSLGPCSRPSSLFEQTGILPGHNDGKYQQKS
jgi:hypothetical protein